ncbi:four-helix bundle copper-binding protein [Meiothermus granaticius]|nr:four-helix bundle copper-binding protein [Thermaceae bacterium]
MLCISPSHARVCESCTQSHEQVNDDPQIQNCIEACRRCVEECRAMARAA